MRYETPAPPAELGEVDGLAYSLWLPEGDPWAGLVIVHGAGSCKESHHDFARAARAAGLSAVCFDLRGHGAEQGCARRPRARRRRHRRGAARRRPARAARLEHGRLPGDPRRRAAARGGPRWRSARRAPTDCGAACAASEFDFRADVALARGVPGRAPARRRGRAARAAAAAPARRGRRARAGRTLARARAARPTRARARRRPGGHHRSVQHDAELQGHALRWLRRSSSARRRRGAADGASRLGRRGDATRPSRTEGSFTTLSRAAPRERDERERGTSGRAVRRCRDVPAQPVPVG